MLMALSVFLMCLSSVSQTMAQESGENYTLDLPRGQTLDMIWIEEGRFKMGTPNNDRWRQNNEQQHEVTISKGFWMGKTEVTQGQWNTVIGSSTSLYGGSDNLPVTGITWEDAMEFCKELTKMEKEAGNLPERYKYTLPTEAQWEYACRAGTRTSLNNGQSITSEKGICQNLDKVGWYKENSSGTPHPVGKKQPNDWELCDMHGNVAEWCLDWYGDYPSSSVKDPQGPSWGSKHVIRGGSYASFAVECRSASRAELDRSAGSVGFRVVLSHKTKAEEVEECLNKARAEKRRENWSEVIRWTDAALKIDMNNTEAENLKKEAAKGQKANIVKEYMKMANEYYKQGNYQEAIKWYKKAEEQGSADAQYSLGEMYYYGRGVKQNYQEAIKWYKKAEEQENEKAQYYLGEMYYYGKGVTKNYQEAIKWYKKAGEQGNAGAQYSLGYMYEKGQGVSRNYEEAVRWYRKGAERGNADAQYHLGVMYYLGQGVSRNYEEAVKWFRKGAEQGNADAQYFLGYMYYDGRGVKENLQEAVKWFRKGAERGHAHAQYFLGCVYLYGQGIDQDVNKAKEWLEKAVEQGDASAQNELGEMYLYGRGVERDFNKAKKLFEMAMKQGHKRAEENWTKLGIAQLYQGGFWN